ncbi:MAG: divergent polysaccharide deacetylase family protein [Caulobacteraceae bacterium]
MFAKKPEPTPAAKSAPGNSLISRIRAIVTKPYVAVGGASILFLAAATGVIALTGDPSSGAPVVRLSLARIDSPPPGWRSALPGDPAGEGAVNTGALTISDQPIPEQGSTNGQVVITLPGGVGGETPVFNPGAPLPQAPLAGLTAQGPGGMLPVIAADGRNSAQAYARPFVSNGKPRIALVIGGLGLNAQTTRKAIETLPPEVTLSFVPYADGLQGWIDMARAAGHEVLLEAPMEPSDYPANDPGPYTLMANGQPAESVRRLEWLLSRATGYFGVTNYLGSKFVTAAPAMATFTSALGQRGLAFIDDGSAVRTGGGVPRASADRIIDDQLSAEAIAAELSTLEATATRGGKALGSGFSYPVTLDVVARWCATLEAKGYQLAPASSVMVRR